VKQLYVIGDRGHGHACKEVAENLGYTVTFYTADVTALHNTFEKLESFARSSLPSAIFVCIAIGANYYREQIFTKVSEISNVCFPNLIDPSAYVARDVNLCSSIVIMPNAVVRTGACLEVGAIVNTGAIVDHGVSLGRFGSVGPGAVCGGGAKIGSRSAISINSTIRHGISVGSDTVIGASSYVHSNLPDCVVAYGLPARIIRSRNIDSPYL
jgi:sugar O-acyltransferase (sialic acid O-acetyltransferase NeuD family)